MTNSTPPADRGAEVLTAEPAVGTETRDELIARALKAEQSLALAVEGMKQAVNLICALKEQKARLLLETSLSKLTEAE